MGARRPTARVKANRLNARLSTGPRTPQGKSASSQNAYVDGLSVLNADTPAVRTLGLELLKDMVTPNTEPGEIGALTILANSQAQVIIIQGALNRAYEGLQNHEKLNRTSTDLDASLIVFHKQAELIFALGVRPNISRRQFLDLEESVKFIRRLARSKNSCSASVPRLQRYLKSALTQRRRAAEAADAVKVSKSKTPTNNSSP